MQQVEWLSIIMRSSPAEIYVIDSISMRLLQVSNTASINLQYSHQELASRTITGIAADLSEERFRQLVEPLRRGDAADALMETVHKRRDGSSYRLSLRLFYDGYGPQPAVIAISRLPATATGTGSWSAPVQAVLSRMPVLVFQFRLAPDDSASFSYLSDACRNLLGVPADRLAADASIFLSLLLPHDRHSYTETMKESAARLSDWNWEGRIWIEHWKDIKWINLRATPLGLPDGSVQWEGIMTNITESKFEELELKRSHAKLAELSAHVEAVKEQERARIAREIHDDMGGNLTAIKMALATLTRRLPQEDHSLHEKASYVDSLIDRTIESAHRIAGDLRPPVLDLGLSAAIDWQAREFEKQSGISCRFRSSATEVDLPPDHATALFRIVQEALTNISKHAKADMVEIDLVHTQHHLRLDISDNGRGIAAADQMKPKSFGIRGMKERASALGGHLSVRARSGGGTAVTVRIPLQEKGNESCAGPMPIRKE